MYPNEKEKMDWYNNLYKCIQLPIYILYLQYKYQLKFKHSTWLKVNYKALKITNFRLKCTNLQFFYKTRCV